MNELATPPAAPARVRHLRLWLQMLRVTRHVEAQLRERLRREFGTTLPRFDVLAALDRAPEGLSMTELSRALKVSNGNVTGIVDRLVADALVTRARGAHDRRSSRVALTAAGKEQFARMARVHASWIDEILAPLGPDDTATLDRLLARINRRETKENS